MDAAGVIAHYVMDGDQPLTAESSGNTTFYLYGLGAVGEKTNAWSYSLPDGTNTPRQLSNLSGGITLSARYTPWGDTLDTYGTGNFTFGYFGGVMDTATGLLYVGNGQYYDPSTGRFLTRDVKPNNNNPYVPWDPTGAIIGPLGVMALFFVKRKKGSKVGTFLVLLLVFGSLGMTLAACTAPNPTGQPIKVTATQVQDSPTATLVLQTPTSTATLTVTPLAPLNEIVPCDLTVGEGVHERTLPYGGNEVMALYNLMKDDHDGWWHKHPQYKFTFEVFIGLMIIHEGAGYSVTEELVREVVSQQLYVGGWNPPYCSIGQCSENAAANQWAAQSQSIHGLVDAYVRLKGDIKEYYGYGDRARNKPNEQIEIAQGLGHDALHPTTLNYDRYNALSVCGNFEYDWVKKINAAASKPDNEMKRYVKKLYTDGYPRSIYYFTGVDDFATVYASVNQANCWQHELSCDEVPNPDIRYVGGN